MKIRITPPEEVRILTTGGESLFNYIMADRLDIMKRGNKPTFVTSNRQEVTDITIATFYAGNLKIGM
jgi:hypothetical protein